MLPGSVRIRLWLSGTGDVVLEQLQADEVSVDHSGVGTIRLSGDVDEQRVFASGVGGGYEGGELVCRTAMVEASGTGKVIVWVTEDLEINVSESGAVAFYGSPAVDQEISGSGTVKPLGSK